MRRFAGLVVGLDIPDEELSDAGLTPVRTLNAACSLLFDAHDVPALAVAARGDDSGPVTVSELQDALTSVAYSAPDELRDDAGALIDHLDLPPRFLDADARAEAQEHADALVDACEDARG